ncbi:MAG: MFS transporter [Corynebacteriales bacterium]|nr:MFS transporter [Mycobacteriales bacterium]
MGARAWAMLLVLCGAIFIEGIDVAMMSVSLPAIREDLGLSTATLSWVMSGYVLGYAGFILLGGRAADLLGRRRMFLFWLVVFLAFSGLGGLASEGWMLILARFITGIAAAFMAPAGLSIITTSIPEGEPRNKAVLIYAGTAAAGFSLGLVVGGLLSAVHWRWVFFAPVFLAAILLVAAIKLIPKDSPAEKQKQKFDIAGALSITAGLVALVYGVVRLEHPSEGLALTIAAFVAAFVLIAVFVVIERRATSPLVRLGILRSAALARANIAAMLFGGAFFGFQFLMVLYLQELRGWSPLETSLALLLTALDAILAPTLTPKLVERFGNSAVILGGMVLAAGSYALFLRVGMDWTYAAMLPTVVGLGTAFALAYGPLTIAATEGIAEEEQGLASGLFYTSWQVGSALGLSAVTAISVAVIGQDTSAQAGLDGFRAALIVPLAAAIIAGIVTAFGLRRRGAVPEPEVVLAG